jgi:hypothetical protein
MKNSIFTIALLLGTGITFAQETPTSEILKTRTKSNQCNERVMNPDETKSVNTPSIIEPEAVDALKTRTKSNNTNERVASSNGVSANAVLPSEKKHTKTGHVTLLK